ncbi:hypothetical protein CDAR_305231 [Caerostris darwini]|uniref:Uncharacterized protein n=1 Tax=Caerostris darwini TaxID=1538125 RepID=A0AAV4MB11_9ARAC|nr:hypothetical protein CDAR_305231 [Caerostris darwini]
MSRTKVKNTGTPKDEDFEFIGEVQNELSEIASTVKNDKSQITGAAKYDFEMIEKLNKDLSILTLTEEGDDPDFTRSAKDDEIIVAEIEDCLKDIETDKGEFQVTDGSKKEGKDVENIDVIQNRMRMHIFEQILADAEVIKEQLKAVEDLQTIRADYCFRFCEKASRKQKKSDVFQLYNDISLIKGLFKRFTEAWRLMRRKMAHNSLRLDIVEENLQKFSNIASRRWWYHALHSLKWGKYMKKILPVYVEAHEKFMKGVKIAIEKHNLDS